jgi:predicted DNA-binding transcriptional regulator AlpA
MKTVSMQAIAACSGLSHDTLQRRIRTGEMPPPDRRTHDGLGWYLSTLRTWRPDVAARCTALVAVLEDIPLKPKAGRKEAKP